MPGSYMNDRSLKFKASLFLGWVGIVSFLCLGGVLTGCQHQGLHPVIKENTLAKQAHQAFSGGDYLLAREKFQILADRTEDLEDQKYGRWGLACVALATAGDASAFHRGLVSFLQHGTGNSTQSTRADSVQADSVQADSTQADSVRVSVAHSEDAELLIQALEHGSRLMVLEQQETLNQIAGLKARSAQQNKEIHKLKALVKTLQHQISTLESIDQDFQEKRKNQ